VVGSLSDLSISLGECKCLRKVGSQLNIPKRININGCRCNERLKTGSELGLILFRLVPINRVQISPHGLNSRDQKSHTGEMKD
jgi:hypothetical protein